MRTQRSFEAILADVAKAGVYHMPHTDKAPIMAAAKTNGFAAFRVNLATASDKDQLLTVVAKSMGFPEWFGHNFDALADCLGDLHWHPAEGYLVMLEHCDGIHGRAEADFVKTLQVFDQATTDWREQGIAFWCLVEMQADGIAWLPSGP
jgi:RNAse (barnase) inhibitor barstar